MFFLIFKKNNFFLQFKPFICVRTMYSCYLLEISNNCDNTYKFNILDQINFNYRPADIAIRFLKNYKHYFLCF